MLINGNKLEYFEADILECIISKIQNYQVELQQANAQLGLIIEQAVNQNTNIGQSHQDQLDNRSIVTRTTTGLNPVLEPLAITSKPQEKATRKTGSQVNRVVEKEQDSQLQPVNVHSTGSSVAVIASAHMTEQLSSNNGSKKVLQSVDSESVEMENLYICPICTKSAQTQSIACDICDEWYHFRCLGIPISREDFYESHAFVCTVCNEEATYVKQTDTSVKSTFGKGDTVSECQVSQNNGNNMQTLPAPPTHIVITDTENSAGLTLGQNKQNKPTENSKKATQKASQIPSESPETCNQVGNPTDDKAQSNTQKQVKSKKKVENEQKQYTILLETTIRDQEKTINLLQKNLEILEKKLDKNSESSPRNPTVNLNTVHQQNPPNQLDSLLENRLKILETQNAQNLSIFTALTTTLALQQSNNTRCNQCHSHHPSCNTFQPCMTRGIPGDNGHSQRPPNYYPPSRDFQDYPPWQNRDNMGRPPDFNSPRDYQGHPAWNNHNRDSWGHPHYPNPYRENQGYPQWNNNPPMNNQGQPWRPFLTREDQQYPQYPNTARANPSNPPLYNPARGNLVNPPHFIPMRNNQYGPSGSNQIRDNIGYPPYHNPQREYQSRVPWQKPETGNIPTQPQFPMGIPPPGFSIPPPAVPASTLNQPPVQQSLVIPNSTTRDRARCNDDKSASKPETRLSTEMENHKSIPTIIALEPETTEKHHEHVPVCPPALLTPISTRTLSSRGTSQPHDSGKSHSTIIQNQDSEPKSFLEIPGLHPRPPDKIQKPVNRQC